MKALLKNIYKFISSRIHNLLTEKKKKNKVVRRNSFGFPTEYEE